MAAPHVSGIAALLRVQNPTWSNDAIRSRLFSTANHPVGGPRDDYYGHGIVDAKEALGIPDPPAAPAYFAITNKNDIWNHPQLQWTASATSGVDYRVYHSTSGGQQWSMIGTTGNTSYTDFQVQITTMEDAEDQHVYHARAIKDGLESDPSNIDWVWGKDSGIGKAAAVPDMPLPREFALEANYPNPFNPSTEIRFAVPEASDVTLVVVDLLGREMARLVTESLSGGYHNAMVNAGRWASGVYLYRMEAVGAESGARFVKTRRMTLLK
jgi:hypothetical protein